MKISIFTQIFKDAWRAIKMGILSSRRDHYGFISKSAIVYQPCYGAKQNVFLYDNCKIGECSKLITNSGKFIMKKNSRSGMGLTVITGNHNFNNIGSYPGNANWGKEIPADVIVEDYVWIGANVTLCPGVHIGRGCLVAAGSVCVKAKEYPPYTIIGGNPAKVIKYRFTLEQQIEHEKLILSPEERLDPNYLKETYERTLSKIQNRHS